MFARLEAHGYPQERQEVSTGGSGAGVYVPQLLRKTKHWQLC